MYLYVELRCIILCSEPNGSDGSGWTQAGQAGQFRVLQDPSPVCKPRLHPQTMMMMMMVMMKSLRSCTHKCQERGWTRGSPRGCGRWYQYVQGQFHFRHVIVLHAPSRVLRSLSQIPEEEGQLFVGCWNNISNIAHPPT
jgi:hypothetical protein